MLATYIQCDMQRRAGAAKRYKSILIRGFNIIELIVAIAVLAVLASLAVSAMTSLIVKQRAKDATSDIFTALWKTRDEAVKRNVSVTLQPSAADWASGWTIPDPANPSNTIDTQGLILGVSISMAGPSTVTYQSGGRVVGGVGPTFSIAAIIGNYTANGCVSVDPSGRPYSRSTSC